MRDADTNYQYQWADAFASQNKSPRADIRVNVVLHHAALVAG